MDNKNDIIKSELLKIQEKIKNMGPPKTEEELIFYKTILDELNEIKKIITESNGKN